MYKCDSMVTRHNLNDICQFDYFTMTYLDKLHEAAKFSFFYPTQFKLHLRKMAPTATILCRSMITSKAQVLSTAYLLLADLAKMQLGERPLIRKTIITAGPFDVCT